MEIERKFLIDIKPENLEIYPCIEIEQSYLCAEPVLRIRRENEEYIFTYKSKGLLVREEYNLPLTKEAYLKLKTKTEGRIIKKKRYLIPLDNELVAEVDIFAGDLAPLTLVEVEFIDEKSANSFIAPKWFGKEVTNEDTYQNSVLSSVSDLSFLES